MRDMTDRRQALAAALGSVRLEDAEPSPEMLELGERWARGEITTEEVKAAAARAAAGEPVTTRAPSAA
jgi:Antitoxin VbhA